MLFTFLSERYERRLPEAWRGFPSRSYRPLVWGFVHAIGRHPPAISLVQLVNSVVGALVTPCLFVACRRLGLGRAVSALAAVGAASFDLDAFPPEAQRQWAEVCGMSVEVDDHRRPLELGEVRLQGREQRP